MSSNSSETFYREYTSFGVTAKYTKATAGAGISYLLDHDYREIYAEASGLVPKDSIRAGFRILEFGCGGGMNLIHLLSMLEDQAIAVENAIGTDFSPVLIEAAENEARKYLSVTRQGNVQFYHAKNEHLVSDLARARGVNHTALENSFHFIVGVNTIRYCHRSKMELKCAQDIYRLLVPGGVCVVIDMNDKFPVFRSRVENVFRKAADRESPADCFLPSLKQYTEPFSETGFVIRRSENFCWVPHSSGRILRAVCTAMTPILNTFAKSRAMRSLVVAQKPILKSPAEGVGPRGDRR